MPSPFPGMDPYLEGSLWTTIHAQLAAEIARQLAPKIRPGYLALTTERFVTEIATGLWAETADIYPDTAVIETPSPWPGGAVAVASPPAPLRLATVVPARVPHFAIEIRDTAHRELVTAIEFLSPTNKRGKGREEYLEKRQRLLRSTAHLLEIDLLRRGQRVPMQQPLPPAPYFVFLSRSETRPVCDVWPVRLDQPLPTAPVPLRAPDPDVPLDLQLAFTTIYDLLGYDLAVDYSRPPEVPLPPEWAEWAQERIRAARAAA